VLIVGAIYYGIAHARIPSPLVKEDAAPQPTTG
jgi:hypothetical protein